MVLEQGGGEPPSPSGSVPAGIQLEAGGHPLAAVALLHSPPASPAYDRPAAQHQLQQQPLDGANDMQVDVELPAPPSRSLSPALSGGAAMASALRQPALEQQAAEFVPLSELGGGGAAPVSQDEQHDPQPTGGLTSEEDGSQPGRPGSASGGLSAGYESGDDMDAFSMRHCINCTGQLWGPICADCGHMPAHDADIFNPTVASTAALHRPRMQGDALTVICWDERMEQHEEGGSSMHPERPDRVRAVMARLQAAELAGRCQRLPAREATAAEIEACHTPELAMAVDMLSEKSRLEGNKTQRFSADTYVNPHTAMCAKLSAGACVDVATAVVRGEARAGVAVVRPPGHHAESNTAMGFCFFNNAGIAARAAQAAGAKRVLVLDWDVHHGNGTQHIFERDPTVLYMSLHRYDNQFYPGTGAATEVGEDEGMGYNVNIPWPCADMRNGDYLAAFHHVVMPIAYEFAPDLVIISAGFDAAEGDPIGGCHLTPECYAHMAAQLQLVGPTVALLEGGYNLLSTAKGTEAVVRVLLGERPPPLPAAEQQTCNAAIKAVMEVLHIQAQFWKCLRGVEQQFQIVVAAAAQQKQLAAMQLHRQEAAAAAALGAGGMHSGDRRAAAGAIAMRHVKEDGEEVEVEGGPYDEYYEEEGEEERQLLGAAHPHHHHQPLPIGGMEGHDDADTDTPHQQYRGGSGWESDADLASDEGEQLSGDEDASLSDDGKGQAVEQQQQQQQQSSALAAAGYGSDASPMHPAHQLAEKRQEAGAAGGDSDTAPVSDSEAPGSDGSTRLRAEEFNVMAASAASPNLLPPVGGDVATPTGGQPLSASAAAAAGDPLQQRPLPPADGEGKATSGSSPGSGHWKGPLAVKTVTFKRVHVGHQRLSPALLDEDAVQQLRPRPRLSGQQQGEHVGPQQEQP